MMVEDLDWQQRATAQPRAFLDNINSGRLQAIAKLLLMGC